MQKMVEREGFEPSIRVSPDTCLAGKCFQPLSHLSKATDFQRTHFDEKYAPKRSRTSNLQIRSLMLYPVELWAQNLIFHHMHNKRLIKSQFVR